MRRLPRPPTQLRLPFTPHILRHIKSQWAPRAGDPDYVMLWAACCVGFFGFMRAGKFTSRTGEQSPSLTAQDMAVDNRANPSMVRIHLKHSKTDPFRHGVDIYLGRTDRDLCPVTALLAFLAIRPAVEGPLFVFSDGSPLTRDKLVDAVRQALGRAGISAAGYSGHSFRIGAAPTAAQAGLEDSVIKMLGQWESAAYQR